MKNHLGIPKFLRVPVLALVSFAVAAGLAGSSAPPAAAGAFPGPNGRIVFQYNTNFFADCCQLVTVRPDGTGIQPLTGFGPFFEPAWSPDGRRLAFEYDSDTAGEIRVADLSTGHLKTVIPTGCNSYPSFSPDGQQLVFATWPGPDPYPDCYNNNPDLFIVNVDGTGLQQLTNTPDIRELAAQWSATGDWITYDLHTNDPGTFGVWMIRPDGTGTRQITPDAVQGYSPNWSPDSRWITFSSTAGPGWSGIYLIHPDGSGLRRLTHPPALLNDFNSAFSPDGTMITFTSDRLFDDDFELFAMNADGTDIHRIVHRPGYDFMSAADWGTNQMGTGSSWATLGASPGSSVSAWHRSSEMNPLRLGRVGTAHDAHLRRDGGSWR